MPIGMQSCYQQSPQNEAAGSQKNTLPPAILLKYYAYLCTKLISMEEYLIISNANFLLRVASDNDK